MRPRRAVVIRLDRAIWCHLAQSVSSSGLGWGLLGAGNPARKAGSLQEARKGLTRGDPPRYACPPPDGFGRGAGSGGDSLDGVVAGGVGEAVEGAGRGEGEPGSSSGSYCSSQGEKGS